jgi:hypothetical protein
VIAIARACCTLTILTFSFANGFVALTTARGLNCPLNQGLLWASFASLAAGAGRDVLIGTNHSAKSITRVSKG